MSYPKKNLRYSWVMKNISVTQLLNEDSQRKITLWFPINFYQVFSWRLNQVNEIVSLFIQLRNQGYKIGLYNVSKLLIPPFQSAYNPVVETKIPISVAVDFCITVPRAEHHLTHFTAESQTTLEAYRGAYTLDILLGAIEDCSADRSILIFVENFQQYQAFYAKIMFLRMQSIAAVCIYSEHPQLKENVFELLKSFLPEFQQEHTALIESDRLRRHPRGCPCCRGCTLL